MKVAYVIGPYRSKAGSIREVVENIRRAEAVALKYWKRGYAVICPHNNSALFDGAIPDEVILEGCLEILRRADLVVVLPLWRNSDGSRNEVEASLKDGKETIWEDELFTYLCPSDCRWLSPSEEEQQAGNFAFPNPHICGKFLVELGHGKHYPKILKCFKCIETNPEDVP